MIAGRFCLMRATVGTEVRKHHPYKPEAPSEGKAVPRWRFGLVSGFSHNNHKSATSKLALRACSKTNLAKHIHPSVWAFGVVRVAWSGDRGMWQCFQHTPTDLSRHGIGKLQGWRPRGGWCRSVYTGE